MSQRHDNVYQYARSTGGYEAHLVFLFCDPPIEGDMCSPAAEISNLERHRDGTDGPGGRCVLF